MTTEDVEIVSIDFKILQVTNQRPISLGALIETVIVDLRTHLHMYSRLVPGNRTGPPDFGTLVVQQSWPSRARERREDEAA